MMVCGANGRMDVVQNPCRVLTIALNEYSLFSLLNNNLLTTSDSKSENFRACLLKF